MLEQEEKTQPIIIDSVEPLELPQVCVCCGNPGTHPIVIKPTEPPTALRVSQDLIVEVAGGIVHPLGLVLAANKLASPNVKIPMCARCHFNYFLPGKNAVVFIVLHIAFFIIAFVEGFKEKYGWMLLALLFAFICLIFVVRINARHNLKILPVRIYRIGKKFRYIIFGGPFYSQLRRTPNLPAQT